MIKIYGLIFWERTDKVLSALLGMIYYLFYMWPTLQGVMIEIESSL